ncbi:MAG: class I SAM-dependent methyltransferase [Polyangiaceae bacterium]
MSDLEDTRKSWNVATRNHNAHKGDQAARFREGLDVLFPEELRLLGELAGKRVAHLQCNAGQDSLGLARRGAIVTGVDLSDEAVAFARTLSAETGIAATFERDDVLHWLATTDARFDVAFASYGVVGWLPDLDAWARGVARVLAPSGKLVYVDFHPLVWSLDGDRVIKDDYVTAAPFREPVGDYVERSGAGLGAVTKGATVENTVPATSWQYGLGAIVSAVARAGLRVDALEEYGHSNGCKINESLVLDDARRWVFPEGATRVPLMFGLVATRPS